MFTNTLIILIVRVVNASCSVKLSITQSNYTYSKNQTTYMTTFSVYGKLCFYYHFEMMAQTRSDFCWKIMCSAVVFVYGQIV